MTTPVRGNYDDDRAFPPERRLARLEAEMVQNGETLEKLKESHDALKKQVTDDRVALAQTLGEIKGGIKMLLVVGSVSGALVMIGLGILGLVLAKH